MTENKRFMLDDAGELIDLRNYKFLDWGDDVCELLNQLVNENEELKNEIYEWKASAEDYHKLGKSVLKENEQLKKELDKLKLVNEMLSMDFSNSEHELWRENEQLKQQLKDYIKDITIEVKELPEKGDSRLIYVVNGLEYIYFKGQWECIGKE